MKMPCPGPGCSQRRRHHEDPFTPRGPQMVEVPDDLSHPVFCSTECACYAGVYNIRTGPQPRSNWKITWPPSLEGLGLEQKIKEGPVLAKSLF